MHTTDGLRHQQDCRGTCLQVTVAFVVEHGCGDHQEAHDCYANVACKPQRLRWDSEIAGRIWYVGCAGMTIGNV